MATFFDWARSIRLSQRLVVLLALPLTGDVTEFARNLPVSYGQSPMSRLSTYINKRIAKLDRTTDRHRVSVASFMDKGLGDRSMNTLGERIVSNSALLPVPHPSVSDWVSALVPGADTDWFTDCRVDGLSCFELCFIRTRWLDAFNDGVRDMKRSCDRESYMAGMAACNVILMQLFVVLRLGAALKRSMKWSDYNLWSDNPPVCPFVQPSFWSDCGCENLPPLIAVSKPIMLSGTAASPLSIVTSSGRLELSRPDVSDIIAFKNSTDANTRNKRRRRI